MTLSETIDSVHCLLQVGCSMPQEHRKRQFNGMLADIHVRSAANKPSSYFISWKIEIRFIEA